MAIASPTVRRRRLAAELRRLRGKKTGATVAKALGWSPAKISRYELGQGGFPPDEVEKLLDYYGVSGQDRTQLMGLAVEANKSGWWEDYTDALVPDLLEFIGLEAEAASESQWQLEAIPGLLQTQDYAWHVTDAIQGVVPTPPSVVEQRVYVRMTRQKMLTERQPPLNLSVVLDESALLRQVGSPEVMRAQLLHMAELADLPNVELRILPLRKTSSIIESSFVIFGFGAGTDGSRALGDVVSVETIAHGELSVEGESDTLLYRLVFHALTDSALSPKESHVIVEGAMNAW